MSGSSDEGVRKRWSKFNPHVEHDNPNVYIGLIFSSSKEFKQAIESSALTNGRLIRFVKNERRRVRAKCQDASCPWGRYAGEVEGQGCSVQVRSHTLTHLCLTSFNTQKVRSGYVAKRYLQRIRLTPSWKVKEFRETASQELKAQISISQARRALNKAKKIIDGKELDQYGILWDYITEYCRTNPRTTMILKTQNEILDDNGIDCYPMLHRLYICWAACKQGWKSGCRPLIGVDGCHLKGPNGGMLLSIVGIDANNNLFPIAYAIVENERTDSWTWFLRILREDLEIEDDYKMTFISDKQKGLIRAFEVVFPNSEHRFCVRHLHSNFKSVGCSSKALKDILWECAKASTANVFDAKMKEMKTVNKFAPDWFSDKPPTQWCRAYFGCQAKCDMLLNNCCESWNAIILPARDQPILAMLEKIRKILMQRFQENRDNAMKKWSYMLCPRIQNKVDQNKKRAADCIALKADRYHFEITHIDGARFTVNLMSNSCSCRKWELIGIPCHHVMATMHVNREMPEDYVSACYNVETYLACYTPAIYPINGPEMWQATGKTPPRPPNYGRPAGRPKKARRREADEQQIRIKVNGAQNEKTTNNYKMWQVWRKRTQQKEI